MENDRKQWRTWKQLHFTDMNLQKHSEKHSKEKRRNFHLQPYETNVPIKAQSSVLVTLVDPEWLFQFWK